jgi:hypothetical protein
MSGMPRWIAILFWIWFFVSLVILVMRRVNKNGTPDDEAGPDAGRAAGPVGPTAAGTTTATPAPAARVWPAPPPPDPDDDTYRMDPAVQGTGGTVGDRVAATTGSVADVPHAGVPRATLPELLAGISLPHDLVPLTQSDVSVDLSSHIVVYTHSASAEAVTNAMCAELERLGYEIDRESMLKLRATGERGGVLVEIHPDGPAVLDGTARRFPTATDGSVVVEIWAV